MILPKNLAWILNNFAKVLDLILFIIHAMGLHRTRERLYNNNDELPINFRIKHSRKWKMDKYEMLGEKYQLEKTVIAKHGPNTVDDSVAIETDVECT